MQRELRKYLASGQLVDMIYLDRRGRMSKRRVRLHAITDGQVKAYCFARRAYRVFALANILAVQPVARRSAAG
ncbi:WYL domain-containing protein [Brevibacillus marinus]|uniref:WYL domain-containing protein n=1 Tax=Brevibacillus marinus TaxID=2496837 RepID=UPI000F822B2F|nr:WYL domain-containing protein [Brevibacillus marinus]